MNGQNSWMAKAVLGSGRSKIIKNDEHRGASKPPCATMTYESGGHPPLGLCIGNRQYSPLPVRHALYQTEFLHSL